MSPVKEAALKNSIPVIQSESLTDPAFLSALKATKADLRGVVAFRILPREVFTLPPRGALNLHASLLPRYRGAAPIARAIMNGETETGVTTFMLEDRVDTGSVVLQARVRIGPDETAGELHDKLADVGAEVVAQTVRLIELGKAEPKRQDDALATFAPKIFKDDCRINWDMPSRVIHNFVRGLSPSPGAWSMLKGVLVRVFRTSLDNTTPASGSGEPGTVVRADSDHFSVRTADGVLAIKELQQEGRKRMAASDFLRGFPLRGGERFGE
jgi:methionyl-tRNA formyltransferase